MVTRPDSESRAEDRAGGWAGLALSLLRRHGAVLLTVCLFAAGLYALHRLLAPLDFRDVLASIQATPPRTYLLAMGATAVGYAALIGYDWSAMRYIGKRIPLPSIALGGFLGYAFGNTIGLSALSGGAVRYRIYTSLGLDGYDVAAISSFAAIAYGVGATLIGLGALAIHPGALLGVTSIPPGTLRPLAIAVFCAGAGIILLLAARQSALRVGRFNLRAPSLGNVFFQMAFSLVDITMAALALYVLLPSGAVPFMTFLAVFAVAVMIGVSSHVPGGVGVFESVVIAALGASVPISDAVTALLLFRLIYFVLPFILALILLSLSEIWTATGPTGAAFARLGPVLQAGQSIIPLAMGMLVLGSGLLMMFSGLLRNPTLAADQLERVLPLVMIEGGAMLSSVVGSALIVLALGIFRRSRAAFWLVLAALGVGIFAALLHGNDIDRALILAGMALLLLPCRREFYRAPRLTQGVLSAQWILFTLAILVSIGATYYLVHHSAPYANAMWWQFSLEDSGPRAQRAALTGSVFLTLALLFAAMRTRQVPSHVPDPQSLARAERIIAAHGAARDLLAVAGDKMLIFAEKGEAVLSYGVRGGSWIALGAPVGTREACESLAWIFHDEARAAGARPVFYAAPERFQRQSVEMGLALHRMGEEAVVPLAGFSLQGTGPQEVAHQLQPGAARWPVPRDRRAAAFGRVDRDAARHLRRLARRAERPGKALFGRPVRSGLSAAVSGRPGAPRRRDRRLRQSAAGGPGETAAIDLMRYRPDAPRNAMEFLLLGVMTRLSEQGLREISLGMAPRTGLTAREGADLWTRFALLVYRRGDRLSDIEGVRRFKAKFDPEWRPRYLCCRSVLAPVGPLADAAFLIAGSARGIAPK